MNIYVYGGLRAITKSLGKVICADAFCAAAPARPLLVDAFAKRVPPPLRNRHRYFGVLAPNSPLRTAGGSSITSVSTRCGMALCPIHAAQCKTRA
ncbi:MAG: hypothetical protein EBY24_19615 [Betaproteobacteria bacterium]|nr:hypothetical protein [Betaproteobacteria bacterium]